MNSDAGAPGRRSTSRGSSGDDILVRFAPGGETVRLRRGATAIDAALLAGVWIDAPCGGAGKCGKCRVRIEGDVASPTGPELELISEPDLEAGFRLACQAVLLSDASVELEAVPGWAGAKMDLRAGEPPPADFLPISTESGNPPAGAAIDIGTTTLCVSLIDLESGHRLGIASAENPQTRFGADVMTRIGCCREKPGAHGKMRDCLTGSLNSMLRNLCRTAGLTPGDVARITVVGNTTMVHLLLGEDPSPLGEAPFEPVFKEPVDTEPSSVGLDSARDSRLLVPGLLSGFLGADILAVAFALGLGVSTGNSLAVDLGTNGETVVSCGGRIMACSTAAGPAFEGAQISNGMRASPGAIESYSRDGLLTPGVLGGGTPEGICGSGLLDVTAALLDAGLMRPNGRLVPPAESESIRPGRIQDENGSRRFLLAPGTDITLDQGDVRQVQLAKGAIRAGIDLLHRELGLDCRELDRVFLAGVFGNFLKPSSAARIGLFPSGAAEMIEFAGNAAMAGCEMMLVSDRAFEEVNRLAEKVEVLDLSGHPDFDKLFIESLSFPPPEE